MARKADLPCADCGSLMWRSNTSLPIGKARCRSCRKANSNCPHGSSRYRKQGCRCETCKESIKHEARRYVARVKERDGLTPTEKRSGKAKQKPCMRCGLAMVRWRSDTPVCKKCRDHLNRKIRINALDRLSLYKRDQWICQICMDPVDPASPKFSIWRPTLDHIIPRSRGGLDNFDNLRLAHGWCNSVRGNREGLTLAELAV